jgi:hypothetical protein
VSLERTSESCLGVVSQAIGQLCNRCGFVAKRSHGNLHALLDAQREGDGFKTYDKLTKVQIKELSDAVNALSEPLSKLAAAVV